jgi:hypothetical protein
MTDSTEIATITAPLSVTPVRSKQEEDLIFLSKKLVSLLEDEKDHEVKDVYMIIDKMVKILGPSYSSIPQDLKKALGVAFASALAETSIPERASYTRTALSLLRGAIKLARGPKSQIDKVDSYIYLLEREIKTIEQHGEEAMLDELWKKTNRADDYLTLMVFNGYGEINQKGFSFERKESHRETAKKE